MFVNLCVCDDGKFRAAQNIPLLEILYTGNSALRVGHHFSEQKRKRGSTQISLLTSVQMSVVDGFAIGRYSEAAISWCLDELTLAQWMLLLLTLTVGILG